MMQSFFGRALLEKNERHAPDDPRSDKELLDALEKLKKRMRLRFRRPTPQDWQDMFNLQLTLADRGLGDLIEQDPENP